MLIFGLWVRQARQGANRNFGSVRAGHGFSFLALGLAHFDFGFGELDIEPLRIVESPLSACSDTEPRCAARSHPFLQTLWVGFKKS